MSEKNILKWTTLTDLKKKLLARWEAGRFLSEAIHPVTLFPMRVSIRAPSPSELSDHFADAQHWIQSLVHGSNNTGITIEWQEINHRQLGRNQVPCALLFQSLTEIARWLGKSKELQLYIQQASNLLSAFPELRPWVLKNPHELLKEKDNLPRLMAILQWIITNPKPSIYLRQLSIPGIDSKFIEQHKKILSEWFDLQLTQEMIANEFRGINRFEARYGFKEKPIQVRFRILDEALYLHGLSDLTITTEAFCRLNLAIKTVFITENDINGLVFPNVPEAIVIFGRGYGFDFLVQAHWLKDKQIHYWGDIDTHGFAILNQCRHHLPQTHSLLMNESTLLNHQAHWSKEHKPTSAELIHLSVQERELYQALKNNTYGDNVRLEQEFINYNVFLQDLGLLIKRQN